MTESQIADVVRRHLAGGTFAGLGMSVLDDGVRQDGDWWYVPVTPSDSFTRTDQYYAVLGDLEQEIEDQDGLNILLVPTA